MYTYWRFSQEVWGLIERQKTYDIVVDHFHQTDLNYDEYILLPLMDVLT